MLYIVATPIGHLGDITYRAIQTLKEVDYIACEDTRTSSKLLSHYQIKKSLLSFHSYSKESKTHQIISLLKSGKKIALISDAGTPGISDPGYVLIKQAIENNILIIPIPWVSACVTALCVSGLPTHHFLYLGFLPVKKWRQTLLKQLQNKQQTVVIYESVHRIIKTLHELQIYFPAETPMVVARELTKIHEEIIRGSISEVIAYFETHPHKIKWEFVILF